MRRWIALLIAFLILSLHSPAQAQGTVNLQELQIDVWPEYDRPGVLVIYHLTLASSVKLPAEMELRIPLSAGSPSAVAEQTANGLFDLQYSEAARDTEWITIRFTTTLPQLQIEYYDNTLAVNGSTRSYTVRWPGDFAVENLSVKVQQPRTASGLTLEPPTGVSSTGQDGLTYLDIPLGQVDSGQAFEFKLSYQKNDDELTQNAAFEQVTPVAPTLPAAAIPSVPQALPWVLGGLGLALIAGGVLWYLRGMHAAAPGARPRHRESAAVAQTEGGVVFCHQCGKKAGPADAFCRSCGAKLRR